MGLADYTATRQYHNGDSTGFYVIERSFVDTYRWVWYEDQEDPDFGGDYWDSISEALRDAAADWDVNGMGSELSRRLRLAAAGYERSGR